MSRAARSGGFWLVWGIVILLTILHQDVWFRDDRTLVFGFMPVGLFYQAVFSLVCGVTWALAVKFCWPTHLEEWADEAEGESGS